MKTKPPVFQHPELDGASFTLYGSKFPNCALLFIHGFTAITVEVRSIANAFYLNGFTVSGPLLPGHGLSPQDLNRKNWQDWTKSVMIRIYPLKIYMRPCTCLENQWELYYYYGWHRNILKSKKYSCSPPPL
jgi:pimeloyl-ACP methyl ester carboxylesterase